MNGLSALKSFHPSIHQYYLVLVLDGGRPAYYDITRRKFYYSEEIGTKNRNDVIGMYDFTEEQENDMMNRIIEGKVQIELVPRTAEHKRKIIARIGEV